ncbi:MAG: ABC transporter ATP-binding protein [Candidatus Eremiobacterota bacterium]
MPVHAVNVGFSAGRTRILQRISLSVGAGEFVGVLGPSGCGKSTLLKAMSGQLKPSEGNVLLNRANLYSGEKIPVDLMGFVPQDDVVHPSLKVARELYFSARLRMPARTKSSELKARVKEVIELMDLAQRSNTRIERLSGGQRKRVSIGIELLTRPPLLFLDEPTSGLDPALEEHFMKLFRDLARGGRTVIVTTHVMDSLELVDHVCILCAGRLAFFGPPKEALAFFQVSELNDVYRQLTESNADILAGRYQSTPLYAKLVTQRFPQAR